jgi:DNA replication and repair protein RecF
MPWPSLDTWDLQLASAALALMADRREAIEITAEDYRELATRLGLDGVADISYRPRSRAREPGVLVEELRARIDSDLERGFTGYGPHRDDFSLTRDGRELRTYGSQGQQRLGLLSLLLAERAVIGRYRATVPLMLLDDVMSELDADRRAALVEVLTAAGGQSLITTTDLEHVPGATEAAVSRITVGEGTLVSQLATAAVGA